jgi:CRISPR-associated protein Cmr2
MSEKYLISISIGPVQDFIASARRSRDLWFGSWLLSELSKVVAEYIVSQKGELIFPSNLNGNVVNKILAIAEISDKDKFDENLRDKIKDRLGRIYKDIFDEIDRKLGKDKGLFYRNEAEAQINDLTELYWAAIPYDKSKDNYKICRERVEILLNARKATRDFQKVTWGDNVPKSSLDGQRESVIEDDLIKNDEIKAQKIFGLRKKERLCGIGVLKRLAEKGTDDSFFSTSHVASLPLLSTLENNAATQKAVKDYIDELKKLKIEEKDLGKVPQHLEHLVFGKYDGHLLFENRLADLPFEDKTKLDAAKVTLKKFMEKAFDKENTKPNPYFALLQADGDRMGKVIDNQKIPDEHKKLSKALSDFANDVKDIVESYKGCLIYAGGDDVLALLPLHTVLDCTKELANKFKAELSKNPKFVDEEGNPPTLSAGIAVCHHTEPLQDSLTTMRNAEKEAKSVKGKNALAIILSKRSGADTIIKGSWAKPTEKDKSFYDRLNWFIYLHLADALPDGVAYELRDLWLRLFDKDNPRLEKAIKAESVRVLKRKRIEGGAKKISENVFKNIEKFFDKMIFPYKGNPISTWTIEDLANEIIVAREFVKAYKQSGETAQTFAEKHNLEETEK